MIIAGRVADEQAKGPSRFRRGPRRRLVEARPHHRQGRRRKTIQVLQIEIDGSHGDATPRHPHNDDDQTFYLLEGESRCSLATSGSN